jgi:chaperonin cofactor prefoldin
MSRILLLLFIAVACGAGDAGAAVAKKQSAIQNGTTVRARVDVSGVYDQTCYDAYYGCMDQFCISENENGGSCACSDKNAEYEKQLSEIKDILVEAERISTIEVEKVKAGANADIIFTGSRQYDEKGNIVSTDKKTPEQSKAEKRQNLLSMWNESVDDADDDFESDDNIANKTGSALFKAADDLCRAQMDTSCAKDLNFLHQVYARQITSDCKAFENSIANQKSGADLAKSNA